MIIFYKHIRPVDVWKIQSNKKMVETVGKLTFVNEINILD